MGDFAARLWLTLTGAAGFALCYYGAAWLSWRDPVTIGATVVDVSLPCLPSFVWVYALGIAWPLLLPWILPRAHWRHAMLGFAMVSTASACIWLLLPSDGSALRLQCAGYARWELDLLYRLDTPTRLFPSLHIGYAVLTSACIAAALPAWRSAALIMAAAQVAAVCLVKQHYLADAGLGAVIALGAYWLSATLLAAGPYRAGASIHPSAAR